MTTKASGENLEKLIAKWRKDANWLAKSIRKVNYPDQATRVQRFIEMQTLRRCANQLKRAKQ